MIERAVCGGVLSSLRYKSLQKHQSLREFKRIKCASNVFTGRISVRWRVLHGACSCRMAVLDLGARQLLLSSPDGRVRARSCVGGGRADTTAAATATAAAAFDTGSISSSGTFSAVFCKPNDKSVTLHYCQEPCSVSSIDHARMRPPLEHQACRWRTQ